MGPGSCPAARWPRRRDRASEPGSGLGAGWVLGGVGRGGRRGGRVRPPGEPGPPAGRGVRRPTPARGEAMTDEAIDQLIGRVRTGDDEAAGELARALEPFLRSL